MTDIPTKPIRKIPVRTSLIAIALLAVGVGGGATIAQMTGPSIEMAPVNPVAIRTLSNADSIVSVRGKVAETFGPMVVLADASGRALVDLGRQGDGTGLAAAGQVLTVQGRYRNGMIRASFVVGADGKVTALRPMGPPHGPGGREGFGPDGGPRGPGGPGGPGRHGRDGGADRGPDGAGSPPPPPPVAAPAATGNSAG